MSEKSRDFWVRLFDISPRAVYLTMAGSLVAWMALSSFYFPLFTFAPHEDFWEHSAAIKEWMSNLRNPGNPHLATEEKSPRYMPFFFVLVLIGRLLHLSAIQVLEFAAVFNTVLLMVGIYLFLRKYFRNDWAPSIGLLIMLSGWGAGWRVSNVYQLRSLFYVAGYPSMFVFSLALISLWLATKALRERGFAGPTFVYLLLLTAVMVLSHPVTAAFAIAAICALALTERDAKATARATVVLGVIVGGAITEFWPFFTVWELISGTDVGDVGMATISQTWLEALLVPDPGRELSRYYDWKNLIIGAGPALLGLPCIIYLALKRIHLFVVLGFILMAIPYFANVVLPAPYVWVGERFLFFSIFFLHLALVYFFLGRIVHWKAALTQRVISVREKVLAIGVGIVLITAVLWNGALAVGQFPYTYVFKESVVNAMERLGPLLPEDSIILASDKMAWPVPTFTGKVVSLYHSNPLVRDQGERAKDVARFFDEKTDDVERVEVLRRYSVSHVLADVATTPSNVLSFLKAVSFESTLVDGYTRPLNFAKGENLFSQRHRIRTLVVGLRSDLP